MKKLKVILTVMVCAFFCTQVDAQIYPEYEAWIEGGNNLTGKVNEEKRYMINVNNGPIYCTYRIRNQYIPYYIPLYENRQISFRPYDRIGFFFHVQFESTPGWIGGGSLVLEYNTEDYRGWQEAAKFDLVIWTE